MAKNMVTAYRKPPIVAACTDPATPISGDPVLVGQIAGVALVNEGAGGNAATDTTIAIDGSFLLSVKGIDQSGNSAVADGDQLYYVTADTPKLSKKNTGVPFGKARGIVLTSATTTIKVQVGP